MSGKFGVPGLVAATLVAPWLAGARPALAGADGILRGANVKGGLCVVLGSGDGALAAGLARGRPFVVHGLEPDGRKVEASRKMLLAEGLYGKVAVEEWDGETLPYADNLVSMIVVVDPGEVPRAEMMRALRPGGELVEAKAGRWTRTVKPRPAGMDEWTHWRHGADGNPASADTLVGVPERIQWLGSRSCGEERQHFVTAAGRTFAQDGRSGDVYARDAFNGAMLWKRKVLTGRYKWSWYIRVPSLIVASGERVYCLAPDGKVKGLDAATGEPVQVYDGIETAGEMLWILLVEDGESELGTLVFANGESIGALDARTGRPLWREAAAVPANVVASTDAVFYVDGDYPNGRCAVVARGLKDGRKLWEASEFNTEFPWPARAVAAAFGCDMLAFELGVPRRWPGGWRDYYEKHPDERGAKQGTHVLSAKTGKLVKAYYGGTPARHGEWFRMFWVNDHLLVDTVWRGMGSAIAMWPARDLGAEPVVFKDNNVGDKGFGHCHPPVVTPRYYVYGQLNLVDLETRRPVSNQITRGACNTVRAGYIPANGLIYTFPKHCACFPMLDGNMALAPAYGKRPAEGAKLVKGPAWGAVPGRADDPAEWPAYRRDCYRSSGSPVDVPAELEVLWASEVKGPDYGDVAASEWAENPFTPGRVTQPVMAGGSVYVAAPDTHRVIALDADTGGTRWEFVANGRVDTPPTLHDGMCIFGSRSGWLFNVRASDGELVWKLRVAPHERRIAVCGQVESPCPVPGSVVVIDGLAYVVAGIHPRADQGCLVLCVEPATGRVVWRSGYTRLGYEERTWGSNELPPERDVWRNTFVREYEPFDLAVRDGDSVAVSRWRFDLRTGAAELGKTSGFYRVKETGVRMPRRAWSYAARDRDWRNPLAAFLGSSAYVVTRGQPFIFRTDFAPDQDFDDRWTSVSPEEHEAGRRSSGWRVHDAGTVWKVDSGAPRKEYLQALVVGGRHLFSITPDNVLQVRATGDGGKLSEMKVEKPVWDGLAAAGGRLYLSAASGKVICLGGRGGRKP